MLVPAGTVLTFQIHYTTNGKAATDKQHRLQVRQAAADERSARRRDDEPALHDSGRRRESPVEARIEFLEDVTLYSMTPHTHLRGKAWEHTLTYPDGRSEILLAVPKYDFNWQTEYVFATPLRVPEGLDAEVGRALRQLEGEQVQPRRDAVGVLGRSDLGRDAVHGLIYSIDKEARTTTAQQTAHEVRSKPESEPGPY